MHALRNPFRLIAVTVLVMLGMLSGLSGTAQAIARPSGSNDGSPPCTTLYFKGTAANPTELQLLCGETLIHIPGPFAEGIQTDVEARLNGYEVYAARLYMGFANVWYRGHGYSAAIGRQIGDAKGGTMPPSASQAYPYQHLDPAAEPSNVPELVGLPVVPNWIAPCTELFAGENDQALIMRCRGAYYIADTDPVTGLFGAGQHVRKMVYNPANDPDDIVVLYGENVGGQQRVYYTWHGESFITEAIVGGDARPRTYLYDGPVSVG